MELIAVAVGAGIVLALVTGGSIGRVLDARVRWFPALVGAAAVQLVLGLWHPGGGWPASAAVGLYLASFGLLLAFCLANLALTGMAVVALGVLANATVVAANGAMPVRLPDDATAAERARVEDSATHALEAEAGRLSFLGQIVPLPSPLTRTVSFGDLILAVGLVDVVFRASRSPRRRRPAPAPETAALGAEAASAPAASGAGANSPLGRAPAVASGLDRDRFVAAPHHALEGVEHPSVVDVAGR